MLLRISTCLCLLALKTLASAQEATSEEDELIADVFGNYDETVTLEPPLTDYLVKPTTEGTLLLGTKDGEECKCVPYNLCDVETDTTKYDPELTGYGVLDIRFGGDTCTESVEKCCKEPLEEPRPPPSPPKVSKRCGEQGPVEFVLAGSTGRESTFGEFPWTVALLHIADNVNFCVGSLIHPSIVLTGAHCLTYRERPDGPFIIRQSDSIKVRAGEWDTQTTKERLPFVEVVVSEFQMHPEFNKKTLYNDIALMRLSKPVELAQHIGVICLPPQGQNDDRKKGCVASGWGKTVFGKIGLYAVIMKKIPLDCIHRNLCELLLHKTYLTNKYKLHSSVLCAGGKLGEDTCQGDGGAPLACKTASKQYYQAGIVSWGVGCGQKNVPSMFARVGSFRDWIDGVVTGWGYDTSVYTAEED